MTTENAGPSQPKPDADGKARQTLAEKVVFVISLGIVLTLVGLVVYASITHGNRSPVITIRPHLEGVTQTEGAYYLPIVVTNAGDQTAEALDIQVTLVSEQNTTETAIIRIELLAGGDSERATVAFAYDPNRGTLRHVVSFIEP